MQQFESRIRELDDRAIAIVELSGSIDSIASLRLIETLDSALQKSLNRIVVDLSQVGYINSAGWGVFISKLKEWKNTKNALRLAAMKPDILEVFSSLALGGILDAHVSVEDAIAAYAAEDSATPKQ